MVKVAVQAGGDAPDTAAQFADPSKAVPFMNCTVPVGLAPVVTVLATIAVSVTLPPEAMLFDEGVTVVVVPTVPPPLVALKLKFSTLSPPKARGLGSACPKELTMM